MENREYYTPSISYKHKIERDENIYFLYRHIRLDKGTPFYIGIGVKPKAHDKTYQNEYKRAFTKNGRNQIWNKIASKSEIKIEIITESSDKEFIIAREIEFIKLYGRLNLQNGILANMTDGGEGIKNRIFSQESRDKISKKNSGKKRTKEQCERISKSKYIPVIKTDLKGNELEEFESVTAAAKSVGAETGEVSLCCKKPNRICKGFKWKYKN